MRMARPGPGNGWRHTIRSGRPSSSPTRRTSSLKSSRSGSTSSMSMSAGRPPTLWCDLIIAATPAVPPEPARLLLEHPDELLAHAAPLVLGVRNAAQPPEEPLRRVHVDERDVE